MPESRRMMIVDDEPSICACLRRFFTSRGFVVSVAFTGKAAIERLSREAPDVLLVDIRLPDVVGIEVLKRARDLCPDTRVVMVTALDEPELRSEAKAYGACGYITKPFDFSECTWDAVLSDPFLPN